MSAIGGGSNVVKTKGRKRRYSSTSRDGSYSEAAEKKKARTCYPDEDEDDDDDDEEVVPKDPKLKSTNSEVIKSEDGETAPTVDGTEPTLHGPVYESTADSEPHDKFKIDGDGK